MGRNNQTVILLHQWPVSAHSHFLGWKYSSSWLDEPFNKFLHLAQLCFTSFQAKYKNLLNGSSNHDKLYFHPEKREWTPMGHLGWRYMLQSCIYKGLYVNFTYFSLFYTVIRVCMKNDWLDISTSIELQLVHNQNFKSGTQCMSYVSPYIEITTWKAIFLFGWKNTKCPIKSSASLAFCRQSILNSKLWTLFLS